MSQFIRDGAKDFYVRQKAIDILLQHGVRPKDYLGEIRALFQWVQRNVRYTRDTFGVEVLHAARRMLELRAGDCDDMTILLGAMLESIGHPVRLVITGSNPQRRDLFSHVYLEVNYHGKWMPADATMPHPLGWQPRAPVREVFPLDRRVRKPGEAESLSAQPSLLRSVVRPASQLIGLIYRSDCLSPGQPVNVIRFLQERPRHVADSWNPRTHFVDRSHRVMRRSMQGSGD